jgi:NCS1 family nucleobase:cation symporter-1
LTDNELYKVERHGIDIIPAELRKGSPRQLFFNWAAANFAMGNLVIGGLLPFLGLNLWQCLLSILVMDGFVYVFSYASLYGPRFGSSTMTTSRAAFGIRGNFLPTLLTWIEAVGWEAVNTVLGVLVVVAVLMKLIPHLPVGITTGVALAVMVIGTLLWSMLGHATILHLQRYSSGLLTIGFVAMIVLLLGHGILSHVSWSGTVSGFAANNAWGSWLIAVMLLVSSAPYGWANFSAEYSRYLPATVSPRAVVRNVFWGFTIVADVVMLLGVLLSLSVHQANPVQDLPHVLPTAFLVPFMLIIVLGLFSANVLNAYTSGLALQTIGIRLPRHQTVVVDMILVAAMGIYALYIYNFVSGFETFLGLMIVWITPWTALYVSHYFADRGPDVPEDLFRVGGRYWYHNGVNWKTLIAFLAGMVAALLFVNDYPLFVGPLTSWVGGGDFSIVAGTVVSLAIYWPWTWRERRTATLGSSSLMPEVTVDE